MRLFIRATLMFLQNANRPMPIFKQNNLQLPSQVDYHEQENRWSLSILLNLGCSTLANGTSYRINFLQICVFGTCMCIPKSIRDQV